MESRRKSANATTKIGRSHHAIGTCLLLACCCVRAAAAQPETFEERRHLARILEDSEPARSYIYNKMFPAIGSTMADAMRDCLNSSEASSEAFSVVADVSQDGRFTHVAYEPRSNTATCFATAMSSFQVPSPPSGGETPFPIVFVMKIKP